MATGDMFFGGFVDDAPELLLTGAAGGRQLQVGEALLRFPGVGVPVCLAEVCESVVGGFWEDHGECSSHIIARLGPGFWPGLVRGRIWSNWPDPGPFNFLN